MDFRINSRCNVLAASPWCILAGVYLICACRSIGSSSVDADCLDQQLVGASLGWPMECTHPHEPHSFPSRAQVYRTFLPVSFKLVAIVVCFTSSDGNLALRFRNSKKNSKFFLEGNHFS